MFGRPTPDGSHRVVVVVEECGCEVEGGALINLYHVLEQPLKHMLRRCCKPAARRSLGHIGDFHTKKQKADIKRRSHLCVSDEAALALT